MPTNHSTEERLILRNIGIIVRNHRKRCKLTQEQLAEMTDMNVTFLSDIERGKGNFSMLKLVKFTKAFDVALKDFFNDYTDE